MTVDRGALAEIATQTSGKFCEAVTAEQIPDVDRTWQRDRLPHHAAGGHAAVRRFAMLSAFAAPGMSLLWTPRLP